MAGRFSSKAGRTALGGVLAAGSLAVLWLACITPTGRLGVTAAAGLFLPALPEWLAGAVWLLYGAGNLVFLLYDWGLSRLIGMMTARLKLR